MKDELLKWKNKFPYDVVRGLGVTPNSSMSEIKHTSLRVMNKLLPGARDALEELRLVRRRLFVDFFLYQVNGTIVSAEAMDEQIRDSMDEIAMPDLGSFLAPCSSELDRMKEEFRQIQFKTVNLEYLDSFAETEDGLDDLIEFDS